MARSDRAVWWSESCDLPAREAAARLDLAATSAPAFRAADGACLLLPYLRDAYVQRRPGTWRSGRASGAGYVELVPQGPTSSEIVVCVRPPAGARGLLWTRRRLTAVARALALSLKAQTPRRVLPTRFEREQVALRPPASA